MPSKPTPLKLQDRQKKAAAVFADGIFFLHAQSSIEITADGFRQDPFSYYFTGLENTADALLAIEGSTGQSWLSYLPPQFGGKCFSRK